MQFYFYHSWRTFPCVISIGLQYAANIRFHVISKHLVICFAIKGDDTTLFNIQRILLANEQLFLSCAQLCCVVVSIQRGGDGADQVACTCIFRKVSLPASNYLRLDHLCALMMSSEAVYNKMI